MKGITGYTKGESLGFVYAIVWLVVAFSFPMITIQFWNDNLVGIHNFTIIGWAFATIIWVIAWTDADAFGKIKRLVRWIDERTEAKK